MDELPRATQEQAYRAYRLWREAPFHPSLQFKRVSAAEPMFSVRIGISYRAVGFREADHISWFWIGSHADYDAFLRRL